jgi:hypothetical protein
MNASTAAAQAAERQSRNSNALLMCNMMQHQTYTPPQVFYNPPPAPMICPTVNCASTSFIPGTVNTTCN